MRVLVAEDDSALADFLRKGLEAERYAVDVAKDGEEAQYMAENYDYDLVILDLNLPQIHGFEILKHLRAKKKDLPVLVLTGRDAVGDRVKGLDLGADDYVVKPCSFSELSARVRALLRRGSRPAEAILRVRDLELNRMNRTVSRAGRRLDLTPKEFALLEYMMLNAERPVTRTMIIEHVWDLSFDTMTNVVDVYVNYLRKKVDAGFDVELIRTIRGVGYQLGDTKGDER
ncbi:MAG: response regulator transcription factor [Nitrospirales bacterium]